MATVYEHCVVLQLKLPMFLLLLDILQEDVESLEDALLSCFPALIAGVAIPVAAKQSPGFQGKALVKGALVSLQLLSRGVLLPLEVWSGAWAGVGATFWLSR
jgi:hypothetical protein